MLAAHIAQALAGVANGERGWMVRCPCPTHGKGRGDNTPSLSIRDGDDGRLLVNCFAGCDPHDVLAAIRDLGFATPAGSSKQATHVEKPYAPLPPPEPNDGALRLWNRSVPLRGTKGERYLRGRGLDGHAPDSLRFVSWHKYPGDRLDGAPCVVAAVKAANDATVAIHRLYLADTDAIGRDPTSRITCSSKAMLGQVAGCAVRLALHGERLGVCEGIETGLAVRAGYPSLPVWAALSASGMKSVVIPDRVRELVILADRDEAGEDAAQALARRPDNRARVVRIARPPAGFKDFNDLLLGTPTLRTAHA